MTKTEKQIIQASRVIETIETILQKQLDFTFDQCDKLGTQILKEYQKQ